MDKPERPEDRQSITSRAEEFLQVFKRGAEFTQELLRENERLRNLVSEAADLLRAQGHPRFAESVRKKLESP